MARHRRRRSVRIYEGDFYVKDAELLVGRRLRHQRHQDCQKQ
jgi:hypothetical protein